VETAWKAGLEDVIAARSAICRVDGEAGRLYYRGYEIGDLARAVSFEDVTALLWFGELPSTAEAVAFAAPLRAARRLPAPGKALLERPPRDTHPLDALRTGGSRAAPHAPGARPRERGAHLRKAVPPGSPVPGSGGSGRGRRSRGTRAATRGCGCPASATASTRSTMPVPGCCAGWRNPWRRPPVGSSSSTWPSACTTRCAHARRSR